jgi:hypothetical protein
MRRTLAECEDDEAGEIGKEFFGIGPAERSDSSLSLPLIFLSLA